MSNSELIAAEVAAEREADLAADEAERAAAEAVAIEENDRRWERPGE